MRFAVVLMSLVMAGTFASAQGHVTNSAPVENKPVAAEKTEVTKVEKKSFKKHSKSSKAKKAAEQMENQEQK